MEGVEGYNELWLIGRGEVRTSLKVLCSCLTCTGGTHSAGSALQSSKY
jgi:hypothetical protein